MWRSRAARAAGTAVLVLLGLGELGSSCAPERSPDPFSSGSTGTATTEASATAAESRVERPPLPPGFPVLPGALPAPLAADDPGLIAAWTAEERGMAAYDFYVAALPAAGYRVEGLYPGGDWAVIRFSPAEGVVWQLLVHGAGAGMVEVEVRLDRP